MAMKLIFALALLAGANALKSKAKPRPHVDTCLEANTHVFLGLNGVDIKAQMPYVEEACDASKGCAMFKKSEVVFHRAVNMPNLGLLMENPALKDMDFEVCLPQTACLEQDLRTGAVVYATQCRHNPENGRRVMNHIPETNPRDTMGSQGCQCGLQQCIDECVDADSSESETVSCASHCQNDLTQKALTFAGNMMCESNQPGVHAGLDEALMKMATAHNEEAEKFNKDRRIDRRAVYNLELARKSPRNYFYDCELADQRPSKYLAKSIGMPNIVGDTLNYLGFTNKY